jgi:hypothetical protein
MIQYRNGLIGKHFRTLLQTCIFHIHGMTTDHQVLLVRALGELCPVLWTGEIEDMKNYLVCPFSLSVRYQTEVTHTG